jgi:hypothetical protein
MGLEKNAQGGLEAKGDYCRYLKYRRRPLVVDEAYVNSPLKQLDDCLVRPALVG